MSNKKVSEKDLEEVVEDFFGKTLPIQSETSSLLVIAVTAGKRSGKLLYTVVEIKRS